MITLYAWPTPNGHKISILLEELGLDYEVVAIDINQGDQFEEEFLDQGLVLVLRVGHHVG